MDILGNIMCERTAQDAKWGVQNHPDPWWLTILMEEVGETADAMLEGDGQAVINELVQVAAVAIAWLECIDRRQADRAARRAPTATDIRDDSPERGPGGPLRWIREDPPVCCGAPMDHYAEGPDDECWICLECDRQQNVEYTEASNPPTPAASVSPSGCGE